MGSAYGLRDGRANLRSRMGRGVRTIAVVNLKGGSGKSTLAVQLGLAWSGLQRTVLADIDPQGSAMLVLGGGRPDLDAIRSTGPKLFMLKETLARQSVDRLIIDTPGSSQGDVAAAIAASDLALMVVRPSYLDLAAAATTGQLIRQLQKPALIVLNQAPPSRNGVENPLVLRALEAIALLRLPVASTVVRSRTVYGRATEQGSPVGAIEPASSAVLEIAALRQDVEACLHER